MSWCGGDDADVDDVEDEDAGAAAPERWGTAGMADSHGAGAQLLVLCGTACAGNTCNCNACAVVIVSAVPLGLIGD